MAAPLRGPALVGRPFFVEDAWVDSRVPDVLLQPHNASLQMMFYEGKQFPAEYRGDIFAAQHLTQ